MEKDESGNYTGYFVRPLNYGQYYKNLNDFVSELNDKFDKEFGHHYIVQQGDNAYYKQFNWRICTEDET